MNILWRRKFSWSLPRQYYWEFCPRAYYYNYIMEWEDTAHKDELLRLKQLCSWEELCRNLLLEGIEQLIAGDSLSGVKEKLEDKLQEILNNPGNFLVPGEREVTSGKNVREMLTNYLDNFLSIFQPLGAQGYFYRLEEKIYYKGLPITVSPDFLFPTPQKMIVARLLITVPSHPEFVDLEACSLILWAEDKFGMRSENIFCDYYYLSHLRRERKNYSRPQIIELGEKIIASAHRMLVVKGKEDFPSLPQEEKCKACKFSSICPDSAYPG